MNVHVAIILTICFLITACNPVPQETQDLTGESRVRDFIPTTANTPIPTVDTGKPTNIPTKDIATTIPTSKPENNTPNSPAITPQVDPTLSFMMCSPLDGDTIPELWEIISDPYKPPPPGREERHHGVDFAYYSRKDKKTIEGTKVFAIMPGTVASVINNRLPYGNMIIIETPENSIPDEIALSINLQPDESIYHLYAHMAQNPQVKIGDNVTCGQKLGEVGITGYYIVNAHLHLETRIGSSGVRFANMAFYDTSASQEEMDNYVRWRTSGDFTHFNPMNLFTSYLTWLARSDQGDIDQE